jgi:hypothetical protein
MIHRMRKQFIQESHKVHNLILNESKHEQVQMFKNYFGNAHCKDSQYTSDTCTNLVPSLSETDYGNLAFEDTTWRQNPRSTFDRLSFSTASNTARRSLFGNFDLDVTKTNNQSLNSIIYHTQGKKHFIMHNNDKL